MPLHVFKSIGSRRFAKLLILVLTGLLAVGALIIPIAVRPAYYSLSIGDVATQEILAPRQLSYTSDVLTQKARDDAVRAVGKVYLPADPSITRRQIENLRIVLSYITSIRADSFANLDQKLLDLQAIQDVRLTEDIARQILSLTDMQWLSIQQETLSVLEQTMRNTIRAGLEYDYQRNVLTLVNFSYTETQANIVKELVTPFIVANSLYSEDLTLKAQEEVVADIEPVQKTFIAGETIVQRGQLITPLALEALKEYGLLRSRNQLQDILAAVAIVLALLVIITLYFSKRKISPVDDIRSLALIAITFTVFLFSAKYVIPNRTVVPYVFPIAAFGLTIASLYSVEVGVLFSLSLGILAAYGLPNALDLTLFYVLSTIMGILVLGRGRRIVNFFWSGVVVAVTGFVIILAYRLPNAITDWYGLATLAGASLFNGVASASLTLLLQFAFSQVLSQTTALQLLDVARQDHPLLRRILQNAPGTYQHSLLVANLAEQAAEAIRADHLLVRVGAIYHDCGKVENAQFFIENQMPGNLDSHDDLDPVISAATIIQHVHDGVRLARKYKLPLKIQNFILEHHGTLVTRYQYTRALQAANGEEVDPNLFRYPGPAPRSRETAIVMLADSCEARARAELPKNEQEVTTLVKKVLDRCLGEGQLENTNLTLRDLQTISESFVKTLLNTYHPRIQYPELSPAKESARRRLMKKPEGKIE